MRRNVRFDDEEGLAGALFLAAICHAIDRCRAESRSGLDSVDDDDSPAFGRSVDDNRILDERKEVSSALRKQLLV